MGFGVSVERFTAWVEECYCDDNVIMIVKEDEDGSNSVLTDKLQAYITEKYIIFEDDRDYFEKIKLTNIKSIRDSVGEMGNTIFEIITNIKTYTYENLGATL